MTNIPPLLLHFTDPHLFADEEANLKGVNTDATLASVLNMARVQHPQADAAIFTGDLSQDESAGAYERLAWALEQGPTPTYLLEGNHDDPSSMWVGLTGQQADLRQDRMFFLAGWQVLLLNSSVPDQVGGELSADSLEWLQRALLAHPNHHTLVCLHHQPVPVGSAWMDAIGLKNGDELLALLADHPQVRGVLWGHVHQEFDRQHGAIRLLSSPSTCIQFAPGAKAFALEASAPGYRWLKLAADGSIDTGVARLPKIPNLVPGDGEPVILP